jgi:death-on-curing protein
VEAHEAALKTGGLAGIRDVGLLESAIGRPYTGYYPRIHQKTAALAHSLVNNHGFLDGNKRTAYLIVDLFLSRSGYRLRGLKRSADAELYELMVAIVEQHLSTQDIATWFRRRLTPKT